MAADTMASFELPRNAARIALRCLDLTSLRDDDTTASIDALAARANTRHGPPAALCVYPAFVPAARQALDHQGLQAVRVATVVNFPEGRSGPDEVAAEIEAALAAGVDEIDAVFPWQALLAGDHEAGCALVRRCRAACDARGQRVPLKVILETGALCEGRFIREAGSIALDEGADFLKTSTGKLPQGATPEAASTLLELLKQRGSRAGLKVAGGVGSVVDVQHYLALVHQAFGEAGFEPNRLRFGASSLLQALLAELDGEAPPPHPSSGSY
jgi:deoxyribose-phosphate aldolase